MQSPLSEKLKNRTVILASGSPRRQELLKGLDIPFTIQTKEVDEVYPNYLQAGKITEYLAKLKADAFLSIDSDTIIITADTIVWQDNKAVMKPRDRKNALEIISKLSNNYHEVYTSVCLKTNDKIRVFTSLTKVYFEKLTQDEISYYIDNYKPFDKAGAYGAQDWIGYVGIKKLKGSYFNVMGLPVHKLYKELMKF